VFERFKLSRLARQVRDANLTYLDRKALVELGMAARRAPQGAVVEAGVALGGSAVMLAAGRRGGVPLLLFDVFATIPAPSVKDGADVKERYEEIRSGRSRGLGGELYYGYRDDLQVEVRDNLERFGFDPSIDDIELIKGRFEDTLRLDEPVALAHLDCDWYGSVKVCLQRLAPIIVPGGRFVVDDYDHWSGARRAVDEFVGHNRQFRAERHGRVHLVRDAR
jgi:hypothetical protein